MAYDLWPGSFTPYTDENGEPASGWTLNWYLAETSTPATVYSDESGTVLGVSVTLNASGLPSNSGVSVPVWLDTTVDYKLIVKNASGVTKATYDNVHGPQYVAVAAVDDSSPLGFIGGLQVTSNATDANNDIDVAVGAARDQANTITIVLDTAITKRLDAAWAQGANQGGIDTGTKANSSTYYVYVIREAATGDSDVLFSLSASNPTMPSGWTTKRNIGRVRTNASGNIDYVGSWVNEYVRVPMSTGTVAPSAQVLGDTWNDVSVANTLTKTVYDGADRIITMVMDFVNNRVSKIGSALFMNATQIGTGRAPTRTISGYVVDTGDAQVSAENDTVAAVMRANGAAQVEFGSQTNHLVAIQVNSVNRITLPTAGGMTLGTGATLQNILTATASLDFPSIVQEGGEQVLTIALTGAAVGDSVILGGIPGNNRTGVTFYAYVDSANVVSVKAVNATHAAVDPTSGSFRVTILKF